MCTIPFPKAILLMEISLSHLLLKPRQNGKQSWGCKSDKAAFPSRTLFVQGRHCNARNGGAVVGQQSAQPGNPGGAHRGAVRQNPAGRVEEKPAGRSAGHGATLERTAQAFGNSAFGAVRRASGACMAESVLLIRSSGTKFADTNEN